MRNLFHTEIIRLQRIELRIIWILLAASAALNLILLTERALPK